MCITQSPSTKADVKKALQETLEHTSAIRRRSLKRALEKASSVLEALKGEQLTEEELTEEEQLEEGEMGELKEEDLSLEEGEEDEQLDRPPHSPALLTLQAHTSPLIAKQEQGRAAGSFPWLVQFKPSSPDRSLGRSPPPGKQQGDGFAELL